MANMKPDCGTHKHLPSLLCCSHFDMSTWAFEKVSVWNDPGHGACMMQACPTSHLLHRPCAIGLALQPQAMQPPGGSAQAHLHVAAFLRHILSQGLFSLDCCSLLRACDVWWLPVG